MRSHDRYHGTSITQRLDDVENWTRPGYKLRNDAAAKLVPYGEYGTCLPRSFQP